MSNYFGEEELKELEIIFGLKRLLKKDQARVRDGVIKLGDDVWWRCVHGPELINTGQDVNHWSNILNSPMYYQIEYPGYDIVYKED